MVKTALVTGATSGIGAAYARKLASLGYDLILVGRREDKLRAAAEATEAKYGVKTDVCLYDIASNEGLFALLEHIKGTSIDALINCAGFGTKGAFHTLNNTEISELCFVQVQAIALLCRAVLPSMLEKDDGIIINVSSDSAFLVVPGNSLYAGVKSFVKQFTEGLYMETVNTNVRVQCVCPSFVRTDFFDRLGQTVDFSNPLMRAMEADEMVALAWDDFENGEAVSIPGDFAKEMCSLDRLPRKDYYKKMIELASGKEEAIQ